MLFLLCDTTPSRPHRETHTVYTCIRPCTQPGIWRRPPRMLGMAQRNSTCLFDFPRYLQFGHGVWSIGLQVCSTANKPVTCSEDNTQRRVNLHSPKSRVDSILRVAPTADRYQNKTHIAVASKVGLLTCSRSGTVIVCRTTQDNRPYLSTAVAQDSSIDGRIHLQ